MTIHDMYWNATISERLLSKQKMQDLKWIKLISPGFAIFCLLHHPDHPFWQKNMTKQPGPLQNSNPCAKGPLYLYKVQIHVQHDTSTTTKFKSMCKMTLLQNSNPGIPTQSWASTKFKSMSKQNPTKPRVKPKKHSTKFRPQVHTKTPSLKPPIFGIFD